MNNSIQEQAFLNAFIQHQTYLHRASSQTVNELWQIFSRQSNEMVVKLRDLLDELSDQEKIALSGALYTTPKLKEVQSLINQWYASISVALPEAFTVSATAFAVYESMWLSKALNNPVKGPDGKKLYTKIRHKPLTGGALVDSLLENIATTARQKVEYAIRDGINSGQTNYEIVKRIRGYDKTIDGKKVHFDGLIDQTFKDVDRVVRTARSHVSNQSYESTWDALGFEFFKFFSVLDGRTSMLCASLDQTIWKKGDPNIRRPPLHPHCRSTLLGVDADGKIAGLRPFVADNRAVKDIPRDQREGKIGQVDANTSYKDWFKRQDESFQREWLGKTRYELYKTGKYPIQRFIDPLTDQKYTLKQLEEMDEKTFKKLGI
ncbi:minor capsid protein [Acinetobacter bereziniae]|uniref:minor capsid protein n=1 Tax=Acinetobacter bereziniae TaxID=106648 RepID=UPI0019024577|nr:minor capsid protein [Acinetobacter bereziniae]MBJ9905363.1 minor capsid protein [Acinetobacter bereziniae]MCU4317910.1 minor capsid protein [Acinetobacter bereziniae]MCU4600139.1 minor capsid protein [Acinetobacter bereziniae]